MPDPPGRDNQVPAPLGLLAAGELPEPSAGAESFKTVSPQSRHSSSLASGCGLGWRPLWGQSRALRSLAVANLSSFLSLFRSSRSILCSSFCNCLIIRFTRWSTSSNVVILVVLSWCPLIPRIRRYELGLPPPVITILVYKCFTRVGGLVPWRSSALGPYRSTPFSLPNSPWYPKGVFSKV